MTQIAAGDQAEAQARPEPTRPTQDARRPDPPSPRTQPETPPEGWLVPLLVLVVGIFMAVLDTTIVNVAIPTIQRDFGASTDDVQWISTSYILALGVVVPLSGWLGERLGATRVYLVSLLVFGGASMLCGLAWDLPSMIAFRILQAVPGGILPVITMSMIFEIVPPRKLGTALGLYGLGVTFGPALGPSLGGYIVEYVSWRLIFFINAPVGVAGVLAGLVVLPAIGPKSRRGFDWWGFGAIASGLFALLLAISEGESWGWTGYRVLILVVFGVLAMAGFVLIELEVREPLLNLRVLAIWPFVNSLVLTSILSVGLNATLFYLPLFMQETQGMQPLRTGLILLPEALTMAVIAPIAGRLYDRFGPRWPGVIGLAIACCGGFLLCGINPDMSQLQVIIWTVVRAVGNALALMPIITAGLASIPPALTSSGAPVNNIAQRTCGSFGLTAMTALVTTQQSQMLADRSALIPAQPDSPARAAIAAGGPTVSSQYYVQLQDHVTGQVYSNMFLVCAWLTAVATILAFFIKKPE